MPLTLRKRGKIYHVRGTVRTVGGRIQVIKERSTGCSRESEAKTYAEALAAKIRLEEIEATPPKRLADAITIYVNAGKSERYLSKLNDKLGDYYLAEITNEILDRAAKEVYPAASSATLRRQWYGPFIAVKNFVDDSKIRRPKDGKPRTHFFMPMQADKFIHELRNHRFSSISAHLIAEFLFGTGARVRETLQAQVHDLYLDYGYVILRDTKNDEERKSVLPPRLIRAFKETKLPASGPIFRNLRGEPYSIHPDRGVHLAWWDSYTSKIGLDRHIYTPHVARHSWATWRYAQDKDTLRLMHDGGWSKLDLVQRYVKLSSPMMAEEARQLNWSWQLTGASVSSVQRKEEDQHLIN